MQAGARSVLCCVDNYDGLSNKRKLATKGGEEQEKGRTGSLYLHLLSASLDGNFSVFYQINSSSEEANFNQKPKLIPTKTPTNLPNIGFGSAICDSILYLFGGWKNENYIDWSNKACYLDLAASSNNVFVPLGHTMKAVRICPITVTIGKKIFIFGSQLPGYGAFSVLEPFSFKLAEVFNTEDKLFELISPPPDYLYTRLSGIGVVALIEKDRILIATDNFSDWFIYDVEINQWTHTPSDTVSPFRLWSMRSPVIDKYIFLYGGGKVCAFDIDKNQFLKNNISLLEYTFFGNEEALVHGVIHHLGGWKFCVVFNDGDGYLVRFVHVVSFEIENPERCGELNIKAGTINVVDHVLQGHTFVDSLLLWSNQIVPSGNSNNGKRSLKSNPIVGGPSGSSSVMSHVGEDCMMDDDYGATSRPDFSKLHRNVAELSRLRRMEAALDKERFEMRLQKEYLRKEMDKLKDKLINTSEHNFYLDKLERWEREEEVSKTNMGECVKNENVSEIKTRCVLEEISSIEEKVEAQLSERTELMLKLGNARSLVTSCLNLID